MTRSIWNLLNYLLIIHFVSGGRGIRRWTWINYAVYAALTIKHYILGAFNNPINIHSAMVGRGDSRSGSNSSGGQDKEEKEKHKMTLKLIKSCRSPMYVKLGNLQSVPTSTTSRTKNGVG